jgi:hypothetical protein
MTISEQFKSLDLKKKNEKVMPDEVGGVKMKKNGKKHRKKRIFFTDLFWLLLWVCI